MIKEFLQVNNLLDRLTKGINLLNLNKKLEKEALQRGKVVEEIRMEKVNLPHLQW